MRRRDFLAGAVASAASPSSQDVATRRRPNILFVFADQLRAQSVGCYGNEEVQTPHLDRPASDGVLFQNTVANTPVCCPARAVMLTGKYAHQNGMVANDLRLRESEVTIGEVLGGAGYRTGFIGKWHLDGGPRLPGFVPPGPRRQGFQFWAANICSHRHFDTQYFRDTSEPIPIRKFEAEAWTDIAIDFLKQSKQVLPFIRIALLTGMRFREIRNLKWKQIDLEKRTLRVGRAKTAAGTGRMIPMSQDLYATFAAHAAWIAKKLIKTVEPGWYVFPFSNRVKLVDPMRPVTTVKSAWEQVRTNAGVECRFHDLRHTAYTKMAEAGVPEETMKALMGHVSREMVERYSHIQMKAKRVAVEVLSLDQNPAEPAKDSAKVEPAATLQ